MDVVDTLSLTHTLADFVSYTPMCVQRAKALETVHPRASKLRTILLRLTRYIPSFRAWCNELRHKDIDEIDRLLTADTRGRALSTALKLQSSVNQIEMRINEVEHLPAETKHNVFSLRSAPAARHISSIYRLAGNAVVDCDMLVKLLDLQEISDSTRIELEPIKRMFSMARASLVTLALHADEDRSVWQEKVRQLDAWRSDSFKDPCPLELFFALARPGAMAIRSTIFGGFAKVLFHTDVEIQLKLQHADEDLRKLLTSARDQIKAVLDTDELFRDAMNLWYNRMLQLAVQDENFAAQEDSITPAGFTSALLDDEIEPIDGISSGIDQLSSITVILAEYEVQVWRINAHWQDSSIPIAERIRRVLAEEHAGTENEPKDASLNTQGQSSPLGDLERMRQLRECLRELVEQLDVIMGLMDDYSVVEKHKAAIEAFLENYLEFEEQPAGSQLPEQPVAEYSQTEHALDTEWLDAVLSSEGVIAAPPEYDAAKPPEYERDPVAGPSSSPTARTSSASASAKLQGRTTKQQKFRNVMEQFVSAYQGDEKRRELSGLQVTVMQSGQLPSLGVLIFVFHVIW